jgi:hypothetical protein
MLNTTLKRSLILCAVAMAMVASLCLAARAETAPRQEPGALISMTLKGTVGVLLDEVPPGQWRETAAQNALQKKVTIRSGWNVPKGKFASPFIASSSVVSTIRPAKALCHSRPSPDGKLF